MLNVKCEMFNVGATSQSRRMKSEKRRVYSVERKGEMMK